MTAPKPGDVATVDFLGATGIKRRPAVVVSTDLYHAHRPDIILAALTTQVASASTPLDYVLQHWRAAGLHQASAFRSYFNMAPPSAVRVIGHLSEEDWAEVTTRLAMAIASAPPTAPGE